MTRRAKPTHGGARPGAGRKPTTGPGDLVRAHLTESDRARAAARGQTLAARVRLGLDVIAAVEDGAGIAAVRAIVQTNSPGMPGEGEG